MNTNWNTGANANPYAAPGVGADLAFGGASGFGGGSPGEPQAWSVGEILRIAWGLYKPRWAPLSIGLAVASVLAAIPQQIAPGLVQVGVLDERSHVYPLVFGPLAFVAWVARTFFDAGLTKASLRVAKTRTARFADVFDAGSRFWPFVAMSFIKSIAIGVGLLFLIVPGVIVALGFSLSRFYVVDQGLGPIESLRASWNATQGQKANLVGLWLAEVGLDIVGLLACGLGFLVAEMVVLVARSAVYMRLAGIARGTPVDAGPAGTSGGAGSMNESWGSPGSSGGPWGPPQPAGT